MSGVIPLLPPQKLYTVYRGKFILKKDKVHTRTGHEGGEAQ